MVCRVSSDAKEEGLNVWYGEETAQFKPDVDIILVQGLGSHPYYAWHSNETRKESRRIFNLQFFSDSAIALAQAQITPSDSSTHPENDPNADPALLVPDQPRVPRSRGSDFVPAGGTFWPRDLLPKAFPKARICTYAYISRWSSSRFRTTIEECGEQLLHVLKNDQRSSSARRRPIIFIGHSFGGLVIQSALVNAWQMPGFDDIRNRTTGIIFLGCPFLGTNVAAIADGITRNIGNKQEILKSLVPGSPFLYALQKHFWARYNHLRMVHFYEKLKSQVGRLIVEQQSATYQARRSYALHANHRGLNKFNSGDDPNYDRIRIELFKMHSRARRTFRRPSSRQSEAAEMRSSIKELVKEGVDTMTSRLHISRSRDRSGHFASNATTASSEAALGEWCSETEISDDEALCSQGGRHAEPFGRSDPFPPTLKPLDGGIPSRGVRPNVNAPALGANQSLAGRGQDRRIAHRTGSVPASPATIRVDYHVHGTSHQSIRRTQDIVPPDLLESMKALERQNVKLEMPDFKSLKLLNTTHPLPSTQKKDLVGEAAILTSPLQSTADMPNDLQQASALTDRHEPPQGDHLTAEPLTRLTVQPLRIRSLARKPVSSFGQSEAKSGGRDDAIRAAVAYCGTTLVSKRIAVTGLPGIGKTWLARTLEQYLQQSQPIHQVFWISAGSIEEMQVDCAHVSERLGHYASNKYPEPWYSLQLIERQFTAEINGRWLLILDGLDSIENAGAFTRYCESAGVGGTVLITTSRREIAEAFLGVDGLHLRLEALDPVHATEHMAASLQLSRSLEVDHLARQLDCVPKMLKDAMTFLKDTRMAIADYSSHLDTCLDVASWYNGYHIVSAVKDAIAMHHDAHKDDSVLPHSATLVAILHSCIHRKWQSLLDDLEKNVPGPCALLTSLAALGLTHIPLNMSADEVLCITRANLKLLEERGLLRHEVGEDGSEVYYVYNIVLVNVRYWLETRDKLRATLWSCLMSLASVYPDPVIASNWNRCSTLAPLVERSLWLTGWTHPGYHSKSDCHRTMLLSMHGTFLLKSRSGVDSKGQEDQESESLDGEIESLLQRLNVAVVARGQIACRR